MSFRKVTSLEELWSGEMTGLEFDGHTIVMINIDDRVYCYGDACPHQKGRLSQGRLTGTALQCPRHHWEFDVCTGQGINPRNACLKPVPVMLEHRDILVDLDEGPSSEAATIGRHER